MISFLQVLRKSKPMSIQLLRPFFQGVMCSISNLNSILQQETYIKQSRHVPDFPRIVCKQFIIKQQCERRKMLSLMSVKLVFLSSGGQTGANSLANFSKTAEQKQTPLIQFVALLEIRIILKNEPNRRSLQGVIAKRMYRTK